VVSKYFSDDRARNLVEARELAAAGRLEDAEVVYLHILATHPGDIEALNFKALRLLARNEFNAAIEALTAAQRNDPGSPSTLKNLGVVYQKIGNWAAASAAFIAALELAPQFFVARLHLGQVLQRLGRDYEALTTYFAAVTYAQKMGHWLNERTTPPPLLSAVREAMEYIDQGRQALFSRLLEPLKARYGVDALLRVKRCLAMVLGDEAPAFQDSRQRPKFLFFPDLPTHPYFDPQQFTWRDSLESQASAIRGELTRILAAQVPFEPFIKFSSAEKISDYLHGQIKPPVWDAYFFFRHGKRFDRHHNECPKTSTVLERLPLPRIHEHAPEVCFSLLTAGTHILPHHGVTNTRLVAHLPLIVPDGCTLNVGGEVHNWQEGKCVIFDDTFLHEAWNRGGEDRIVLIFDVWNPYLTEVEQLAVTELVTAIGMFNRDCGLTTALATH